MSTSDGLEKEIVRIPDQKGHIPTLHRLPDGWRLEHEKKSYHRLLLAALLVTAVGSAIVHSVTQKISSPSFSPSGAVEPDSDDHGDTDACSVLALEEWRNSKLCNRRGRVAKTPGF